jgi:tRNA(fMet)-specific endonuclease VapC
MIYALDSNTVSYLLKGDSRTQTRFQAEIDGGAAYVIPPLVYYEIKRGLVYVNAKVKLEAFLEFCGDGVIGQMDLRAWDKAVEIYSRLRARGILIDDADLLIAAFCAANDYVLVTDNTRHFQRIDGLTIVSWKD